MIIAILYSQMNRIVSQIAHYILCCPMRSIIIQVEMNAPKYHCGKQPIRQATLRMSDKSDVCKQVRVYYTLLLWIIVIYVHTARQLDIFVDNWTGKLVICVEY